MANIWEKAISILAGNLNLGHSDLITTVQQTVFCSEGQSQEQFYILRKVKVFMSYIAACSLNFVWPNAHDEKLDNDKTICLSFFPYLGSKTEPNLSISIFQITGLLSFEATCAIWNVQI